MEMTEHYAIYGDLRSEQKRARDCIARAFDEAVALDTQLTGERFAEAVLARLVALQPPMLVVALDPAGEVVPPVHGQGDRSTPTRPAGAQPYQPRGRAS